MAKRKRSGYARTHYAGDRYIVKYAPVGKKHRQVVYKRKRK